VHIGHVSSSAKSDKDRCVNKLAHDSHERGHVDGSLLIYMAVNLLFFFISQMFKSTTECLPLPSFM